MGTHFRGKANEVQALDAYIKLMRAHTSVERRVGVALAGHRLTENQLGVLEVLLHLGPQCQRSLGSKLFTSNASVTQLVDQLEKRGWVRRERDAGDRRFITVHLSDEGRTFIERVFPEHAQTIASCFDALSPAEQAELGRLCRKLGLAAKGSVPCDEAEKGEAAEPSPQRTVA